MFFNQFQIFNFIIWLSENLEKLLRTDTDFKTWVIKSLLPYPFTVLEQIYIFLFIWSQDIK